LEQLVFGTDGDLYGLKTTFYSDWLDTRVIRVTLDGVVSELGFSSVGTLAFLADWRYPRGVVAGTGKELYAFSQSGTVAKIASDDTVTTLTSFAETFPTSLILGLDGHLYGTTDSGVVFTIDPDGSQRTLYTFRAYESLTSGLVFGNDGNLYGVGRNSLSSGGALFRFVRPPAIRAQKQPDGKTTLSWNSFTNGTYRVEYRSAFTDADWTVLTSDVTAVGPITTLTDDANARERYYRVRLLP
jgi:hypothetical protein